MLRTNNHPSPTYYEFAQWKGFSQWIHQNFICILYFDRICLFASGVFGQQLQCTCTRSSQAAEEDERVSRSANVNSIGQRMCVGIWSMDEEMRLFRSFESRFNCTNFRRTFIFISFAVDRHFPWFAVHLTISTKLNYFHMSFNHFSCNLGRIEFLANGQQEPQLTM